MNFVAISITILYEVIWSPTDTLELNNGTLIIMSQSNLGENMLNFVDVH